MITVEGMQATFLTIKLNKFEDNCSTDKKIKTNTTFIAIIDNGLVIGISNVPIKQMCTGTSAINPQVIEAAIQTQNFFKFSLPITRLLKALIYTASTSTTNSNLQSSQSSSDSSNERAITPTIKYNGFHIVLMDALRRLHRCQPYQL
jgi:hypothetical protein